AARHADTELTRIDQGTGDAVVALGVRDAGVGRRCGERKDERKRREHARELSKRERTSHDQPPVGVTLRLWEEGRRSSWSRFVAVRADDVCSSGSSARGVSSARRAERKCKA